MNNKNVCFFYQVWYKDKRSIYESLSRLRKFHPNDELIVVIAGLQKSEVSDYHNNYTKKIEKIFNITLVDYLTMDEFPGMNGNGKDLTCFGDNYRDTWINFSYLWLDRMVKLPSENTDILVACSDDWMIWDKVPIDYSVDSACMMHEVSDWMDYKAINKHLNTNLGVSKFPWWPAAGCYMNIKKFRAGYTEESKEYIRRFMEDYYGPKIGMYLDFLCGLWILYLFKNNIDCGDYIYEYDTGSHIITKLGGSVKKDVQEVDEYPEDIKSRTSCISVHSYKTFRGMEMINLHE